MSTLFGSDWQDAMGSMLVGDRDNAGFYFHWPNGAMLGTAVILVSSTTADSSYLSAPPAFAAHFNSRIFTMWS